MKVKQNIQVLIKMIGIVVISSIVLVGLLCLVYKLPRNRMVEHVIESDNTIRLQNDDYNMSISNFYDTYDTDTNIIMLLEAIAPDFNGSLQDALLCPSGAYLENQWGDWADTLMNYANDAQGDLSYVNYARYWAWLSGIFETASDVYECAGHLLSACHAYGLFDRMDLLPAL